MTAVIGNEIFTDVEPEIIPPAGSEVYGVRTEAEPYIGDRKDALGLIKQKEGYNFSVHVRNARGVDFCVPDPEGNHANGLRWKLKNMGQTPDGAEIWGGHIRGLMEGDLYTVRIDRENDAAGYANPLIEPRARGITRLGHPDHPDSPYFCVVLPETDVNDRPEHVHIDPSNRIIYEAHIVDTTKLNPEIPEELRGTYAGFGHPANIAHLKALGITTVELQPIQTAFTEKALVDRGVKNHWKYAPIGFNAPDEDYASDKTPGAVQQEVKEMIHKLHEAGLEVILDVVYNHTTEGQHQYADDYGNIVTSPTYSFRGLDDQGYYTDTYMGEDGLVHYIDTTGCGNMIDTNKPAARSLVKDSIAYWYEEMGFDGFRYDLASSVGDEGFYRELLADPRLKDCAHFAEPWDFGPRGRVPFAALGIPEWNDEYRDGVRDFWGKGPKSLGKLAYLMAGSFDSKNVINLIDAHDGQTWRDIVTYEGKYNHANRQPTNNGTDDNHSFNHGHEGPTDDPDINHRRWKTIRNMAFTLFMSRGTPMYVSGDENGLSKHGNNNTYSIPFTPDEGEPDIHSVPFEHLTPEEETLKPMLGKLALVRSRGTIREQGATMGRLRIKEDTEDAELSPEEQEQRTKRAALIDECGVDWFRQDGARFRGQQDWDPARVMGMYSSGRVGDKPGSSYIFYANGNQFSDEEVALPKTIGAAGKYVLIADSSTGEIDPNGIRVMPDTFTMEEGSSMIVEKIASTLPPHEIAKEHLPTFGIIDLGHNLVEIDIYKRTQHTVPTEQQPTRRDVELPAAT